MIIRRSLRAVFFKVIVLVLSALWASAAFGQGILQLSSTGSTVSRTGHTELVGNVSLTVVSGTTVAGSVEVTYGLILTKDPSPGVSLTGTGGLVGATLTTVIADSGILILSIPAGATTGASLTINGVRTSVVGRTSETAKASISSTGNAIVAGQNSMGIINRISETMVVESNAATAFTFQNGVLISGPGVFSLREGSEKGFSGTIGVLGQTVSTQLIFKISGLPDNVSVIFPATLTSNSSATFTTVSALPETLSNQSATNRIVYNFSDSFASSSTIDSFSFTPTISMTGQVRTGTAFIQVSVGPHGVAKPTSEFPSTAIPRYSEQFLPVIEIPVPMPIRFFLPVPSTATSENIVITNTATGGASVTIRARGEDGALISGTNLIAAATINLLAKETRSYTLAQLFGSAAGTSQIASVEVASQNDQILASSISVLPGGKTATAAFREFTKFYLPFDRRTSDDVPMLAMVNSGLTSGVVQFTLRTSLGATVATSSVTIPANGAMRAPLTSLLNLPPGALPLHGYLLIDSTVPLRSVMFNHPAEATDAVAGLLPVARSPMIFPFYAFGGGYSTVVSLINASSTTTARLTLSLYSRAGVAFTAGAPLILEIAPQNRADFDLGSLFATGLSSVLSTGYVVLTVQPVAPNLFASLPAVLGTVRVATNSASVLAPMVTDPGTEFFITPTAETSSLYTGLAMTNDGSAQTTVTLEAFSNTGTLLGTKILVVPGNNARIELLRELIPASLPHDDGFVRISSTSAINVVAFRGNLSGTELIHLTLQRMP